jgi:hypothetical protein
MLKNSLRSLIVGAAILLCTAGIHAETASNDINLNENASDNYIVTGDIDCVLYPNDPQCSDYVYGGYYGYGDGYGYGRGWGRGHHGHHGHQGHQGHHGQHGGHRR